MTLPDYLIYPAHGLYWTAFCVANAWSRRERAPEPAAAAAPVAAPATATHSRLLIAFHSVAFAAMYFGIGQAIFSHRVPSWFAGQDVVGLLVIGLGAVMICWARLYFRSWRFRAQLDAGHELATGGPFHWVRHPIYLGLNLLALGSAIWIPSWILWVAVVLMVIGSDLRGRAEERLLGERFGQVYRDYCRRTRRFVPVVY